MALKLSNGFVLGLAAYPKLSTGHPLLGLPAEAIHERAASWRWLCWQSRGGHSGFVQSAQSTPRISRPCGSTEAACCRDSPGSFLAARRREKKAATTITGHALFGSIKDLARFYWHQVSNSSSHSKQTHQTTTRGRRAKAALWPQAQQRHVHQLLRGTGEVYEARR